MTGPQPSRLATAGLLTLLVLAAGWLRLANLDWDRGAHLHPDERYLAIVSDEVSAPDGPAGWFDTGRSPLNPANHGESFVYGTAPLFLTKGVATWLHRGAATGDQPAHAVVAALDGLGVDLLGPGGDPRFDGGYNDVLVGRMLSALLDTVTTLLVFELGRLAGGRRAGLAAAAVWATCVLAIQHAHFFVVEPMLVLATATALVAAGHVARGGGRDGGGRDGGGRAGGAWLAVGGAAAGLAGASKVSGLAVGAIVLAAAALHRSGVLDASDGGRGENVRVIAKRLAVDALVVGGVAFLVFRVLQPYAFDGLGLDQRWLDALRELSRLQAGGDVPSNVQWANRVPVLEPVGHLVRFGFGVPATILCLVGLAALRRRAAWRTNAVPALLALWVLLCGALFLPRFVPAMRYMLPAYPALAALAGCGAARLLGDQTHRALRIAGGCLLAGAILWGLAFVHGVQSAENPRLAASDWLVDNVPAGATLSFQEWDDGLPVSSPEAAAKGFRTETLRPFAVETPDDVRALAASLARIDYVVESSERITGTVGRIPARYGPVLRYYRGLDDGSLGFAPVATFSNSPTLLGVSIDDTGSEEAFRVYDHPTVRIWRKTAAFSLERALAVLQPDRATASVHVPLDDASANGLQLRDGDRDDGPTFDDAFPGGPPAPWLWWFAWWEVTALAAVPWVTRLFRSLPDRGLGLAKVLGPMAVVVPLWAAVAWGRVSFSGGAVWGATGVALAVGLVSGRWRRDAVELVRSHRRLVLTVEALTVGVFLAVLLLRAANPDLWFHPTGGEKPFDTAFFTSVARSSTFPPADPWFSGGSMNYYYGGWFSLAVPTRALGLRPEVALNLGLATVASLIAAASWSIGTGLAALGRSAASFGRVRVRVGAGLLAAGAVLVAGNLDSIRQEVVRAAEALSGRDVVPFDWWSVSRLHPGTTDIDEFPAWSVLFGDPHPHLLSLPALLATVGVLCAYVVTRRDGAGGRAFALAVIGGAAVAWTRIGHTWDLPAVAVLGVAAAATGSTLDRGNRRRWRAGAVHLAAAAVTTELVAWPYVRATQVFDRGFTESATRTPVNAALLQFGVPLGVTAVFLVRRAVVATRAGTLPAWLHRRAEPATTAPAAAGSPGGALPDGGAVEVAATASSGGPLAAQEARVGGMAALVRGRGGAVGLAVAGVGTLLVVAGLFGWVVAIGAVVAAGALASAVGDLRAGETGRGLAAGLVAAGAALAVVPDLVTVVNDIARQNTVFKFWFTAWALMGLGAAVLAVDLARSARHRRLVVAALAAAGLATLVFWPAAAPGRLAARFAARPLTVDGRAWLDDGPLDVEAGGMPPIDVTADEPLVAWLRAHGRGGETIVEAVGPSYSWVGRMSVATGLPTVVGWEFHEQQQRRDYAPSVQARTAAVTSLYRGADSEAALRVLAAYQPDYVVVGTVERAVGTTAGLQALADLPGLSVAYRHADGAVYRVDHQAVATELARIDAGRVEQAGAG